MVAIANGFIKYNDLIEDLFSMFLSTAKNVGDDYDSSVPEELKHTFSYTFQSFATDGRGYVPKVVWTNSEELEVVSVQQFYEDFESYCIEHNLVNDANKDKTIEVGKVINYLTSVLAFVTSRFATVYSPLTSSTSVFYFRNNPISDTITNNYTNVEELMEKITLAVTHPSKSFLSIKGYELYGN